MPFGPIEPINHKLLKDWANLTLNTSGREKIYIYPRGIRLMIDISSKELPIAVKFQSVFSGKYKRNLLESVQCWQPAHSTISVWQFSISSATGDWADPGKSCWCELKLQQPLLKTDVSNAKQTKKRGFERMTANVWIWSCSDLSRERKKKLPSQQKQEPPN